MKQASDRKALTTVEVLVSAIILMTIMTFVASLAVKVGLVWRDVGHQRVAICELANQLEELTLLSPAEAESAVKELEASVICARTLKSPELKGVLEKDELGTRVTLAIDWKRRHAGKPVELSGWIVGIDESESKRGPKANAESDKSQQVKKSGEGKNGTSVDDEPPKPRPKSLGAEKEESK